VVLRLAVHYPGEYPEVLPELTLEAIEGELSEQEISGLLTDLHLVVGILSLLFVTMLTDC
jgi:hypothetical protein